MSGESREQYEMRIILQELAGRLLRERFVIDGVNQEARENNKLVVEAIAAAGESLPELQNRIFAINMAGSRIKGYNTAKSDIDLFFVKTDQTTEEDVSSLNDRVVSELAKRGISDNVDEGMAMWSEYDIVTDVDGFIEQVDKNGDDCVALFGYIPYKNPNLNLTRMAILEIMMDFQGDLSHWSAVSAVFNDEYIGHSDYITGKLAKRYGMPIEEVEKVFKD